MLYCSVNFYSFFSGFFSFPLQFWLGNLGEMVNSGNESENYREVDNANAIGSDGDNEEEEVRWLCLGCAGEEAINFKRRAYVEELENLLANQPLKCEEEAYKLYCDYAYAVGFSVRKGKQYYFPGTNRIRAKWYCCSKEGFSYDKDDGSSSNSNKLETRTGCKAMIYYVCDNEGQWKASKFVKEHNHEMAELSERQFLRSARVILASNSATTAPMVSSKTLNSAPLFCYVYIFWSF